jgi:hypothetical protein
MHEEEEEEEKLQNGGQNFYVHNSTKLTSEAMRERWRQREREI